jgi:hypothetical protein
MSCRHLLNRKLEGHRASLDGFEKTKYSSLPGFELKPQSLSNHQNPVSLAHGSIILNRYARNRVGVVDWS